MLYSAEIRWFFEGAIEPAVDTWFRSDPVVDLETEDRVDRYLVIPGCESVGIKIRDFDDPKGGKFEVKAALGAAEVLALTTQVHGRADTWAKWTFPTEGFEPWVVAITTGENAEPTWVTAHKLRWLRKFSLDTGSVTEVDPDVKPRPHSGCSAELVTLDVGDAVWWTFGFESFGSRFEVRANLRQVAHHWFDQRGVAVARLPVAQSVAYPTWAGGFIGP